MTRAQRLRRSADFARVREQAERGWPHPLLVLYVAPNDLGFARVGITVSGRVGKAVVRNRVRRRVREAFRQRLAQVAPHGVDIVLSMRPASARATWAELGLALDGVLRRAGLAPPAAPPCAPGGTGAG
jgi:ribonuclease P protein component